MASAKEKQFWKKLRANDKQAEKLYKPLREASLAIELTLLMEDALDAMDADKALQLEKIGGLLESSGLFKNDVRLPFDTDGLTETLISDYIAETNEGAVEEDDYYQYNFYIAGSKPTVEALAAEREKLSKLVSQLQQKITANHDKEMAKHYAANKNWRKQKAD